MALPTRAFPEPNRYNRQDADVAVESVSALKPEFE